jgi:hypothetical protein
LLLLGPPVTRFYWIRLFVVGIAIEWKSRYLEECPDLVFSENGDTPNLNFGFERSFIDK